MATKGFGELIAQAAESGVDVEVQNGTYTATIVSTNHKFAQGSGKWSVGALFRIDNEGPMKGGTVWSNQYLSPESAGAMSMWFRAFNALGIPTEWWGQFGADFETACREAATMVNGRQASIIVERETYNGRTDAKVKRINKLGSAPSTGAAAPSAVRTAATPAPGMPQAGF